MRRCRFFSSSCLSFGMLVSLALTTGCVTPQKTTVAAPVKKKPLVMKEKPGAKSNPNDPTNTSPNTANEGTANASVAPATVPPQFLPLEKRQANFIQTHLSDENKAVTEEEERTVTPAIGDSAAAGSLGEACAVIIINQRVLGNTVLKTPGFVEQDTTPDKSKSPAQVETMAQQRLIDYPRALETNAFLQNPAAQKMALRALEKSSDTPAFKERAFGSMRRLSDQWTSHLVSLGRAMGTNVAAANQPVTPGSQPGAATTGTNGVAVAPPAGAALTEAPVSTKPVDVKPVEAGKEESALLEAQNLADAGKYQEAIAKAQGVSSQSAVHAKAQEFVRNFSNRAVQELRMKAAQAFQGSLPISDPKARTAYLERARKFLEEAIKVYPHADQLGTVKENLAVITRDIERLKEDGTKR